MNPEMATPIADLLGPVIGAWLLLAWVLGGGARRIHARLAKRAGKAKR